MNLQGYIVGVLSVPFVEGWCLAHRRGRPSAVGFALVVAVVVVVAGASLVAGTENSSWGDVASVVLGVVTGRIAFALVRQAWRAEQRRDQRNLP